MNDKLNVRNAKSSIEPQCSIYFLQFQMALPNSYIPSLIDFVTDYIN